MKRTLSQRSVTQVVFILAPLIFTFAFALDIYVPSIPSIQTEFHTNQDIIQLTISLFLLITGLGQLLSGPISDQVGRRKVALLSALLFTIGSILCAISSSISMLIFSRCIQAFGACGMFVSAFAMVRDLFSGDECATIYSYLNSTVSLSPLIGPIIGGYLEYWINWRASFAFLSIAGLLVCILIYTRINETLLTENKRALRKETFKDYYMLLKDRRFLAYTFSAAAGFASFLTFFSSSSYIIIDLLHIPEQHFGFYFAIMGIVFFLGSLLSGWLAKRIGTYFTVIIGTFCILISGIMMASWYLYLGLSIAGFMAPMVIMNLGGAMAMGGSAGGAIEPFPEMAGTASALFGSGQFVFAFAISQIVLLWPVHSTLPLAITLIALGFLATLNIILQSHIRNYSK